MRTTLLTILCFYLPLPSQAQETINLQQAIDLALKNNLQLKQAALSVQLSAANVWQARGAFLPSLNGFAGHTWNYGRTIDPFTNQFATNTVQSNNFGLNSSVTLFNGLQNHHSLKQTELDLGASQADLEGSRNDVIILVISSYMQTLFAESLLKVRSEQVALTRLQMERVSKLVEAGALAQGSLLDAQAQLASEELNHVTAQNNLEIAKLTLRQLLEIPADRMVVFTDPEFTADPLPIEYSVTEIYGNAVQNMPEIRSADLRVKSAGKELSIARSMQSPRLTLSAGIGTGYSELRREPSGVPVLTGYDTLGITTGMDYVLVPNYTFDLATIPFTDQVADNLNRQISFNLTIPILNGLSARTNITRAKIARENADLSLEIAKRDLEKNVQQAFADAVGAYNRFMAASRALEAADQAYEFMEKRFDLGAANQLELREAANVLVQARSESEQSRYDYFFKKGILEFYKDNRLTF